MTIERQQSSVDKRSMDAQLKASPPDMTGVQHVMVLLLVSIIALLPAGRLSEIPIIIFMVWGSVLLIRQFKKLTALSAFKPFTYIFFVYLSLITFSAFDSYWPEKTTLIALSSLRFYLLGLVVLYHSNTVMIQQVIKWVSFLMIFWALDAMIQNVVGHNLFGQTSYSGRLTGLFGQNVKLGPVLALMLPLVMVHMCRYKALWRWLVVGLMVAVILLSGTRSAWLMMAFVLLVFWFHHAKYNKGGRRWMVLFKAGALTALAVLILWFSSHDFQQRMTRSLALLQADEQAIDFALADRLPIWKTALNMYVNHPINGVGARAFRKVYIDYSEPGDIWVTQNGGGLHAHHWVLELLAETGTIGLLLMLWMMVIITRNVKNKFQNNAVWPFGVALMAALLPVVSLYSLFSSFWSICLWWLLILLFAGAYTDE